MRKKGVKEKCNSSSLMKSSEITVSRCDRGGQNPLWLRFNR